MTCFKQDLSFIILIYVLSRCAHSDEYKLLIMLKFLFLHKSNSSVKCNELKIANLWHNTALFENDCVLFLGVCVLTVYKQIVTLHQALQFMCFSKRNQKNPEYIYIAKYLLSFPCTTTTNQYFH